MNCMLGYLLASRLASRKVFSANGQPQCLKNTTTVGLPSPAGNRNLIEVGARVPITGVVAMAMGGGTGVAQDCHDFGTERFARGFAKGSSSFC